MVIQPDPQADKLLVLMHGYGAPGDDLLGLVDHLPRKGWRYLFPAAPLDLDGMGRAWWHIDWNERAHFERAGDWQGYLRAVPPGLDEAVASLNQTIDDAVTKWSPQRLVLGGFSQGAMMAVHVAAHRKPPPDALVLLSGAALAWPKWGNAAWNGMPIFQSHGTQDVVLPYILGEDLHHRLTASGARVTWFPFHGPHGIPAPVLAQLTEFLGTGTT